MSGSGRTSVNAMTAGSWIALLFGLASIAVVAAFARWSAWWPHSDMRQNAVTLFGFIAAIVGALTFGRAVAASPPSRRPLILITGAIAVALGLFVGFPLMVNATAWAK